MRQLTLYYLLIALGGALGGIFVSLGAPTVFYDLWEFHLAIVVGWMVIGLVWATDKSSPFHIGDRALFATLVTITSWLVLRYLIERTRFGGIEWVSGHGWPVTIVGGILVGGIVASLRKSRLGRLSVWPQLLWLLVVLLSVMFLLQRMPSEADGIIYAARNFYGVVRVSSVPAPGGEARRLIHGTTVHGAQVNLPGYRTTPTSYYSRTSGIAQVSRLLRSHNLRRNNFTPGLHFGVLGMGIGTMSAFGQSADRFRYYEINPEVIEIASGDQPYFTFVRDSASDVALVTGDARLSLERELRDGGSQQFDILVMDAFSGDSVPVHLLTLEAFRLYAAHLRDEESILAVNVTNRYLGLEPVVAANAQDLGFHGIRVDSPGDPPIVQESSWILLARDPQVLRQLSGPTSASRQVTDRFVRFTDKYSNLFRVLK